MPDSASLAEVRARLQGYLLGQESLPEFHNWFVVTASRLRRSGGADATVKTLELRFAEYKRGDWSEAQLRGLLLRLLEANTLSPTQRPTTAWTTQRRDGQLVIEKSGPVK